MHSRDGPLAWTKRLWGESKTSLLYWISEEAGLLTRTPNIARGAVYEKKLSPATMIATSSYVGILTLSFWILLAVHLQFANLFLQ